MANWLYRQASGELSLDGAVHVGVGYGYSGHGDGKNNPDLQRVPNVGPIPAGSYTIGTAYTHPQKGPLVMRLTPHSDTFGRSGFLIHGDSIAHPGEASEGCIILSHSIRQQVSESACRELIVTP